MSIPGRKRVSLVNKNENGPNVYSDGNIRYFEYENDKFEFLSEYKSGDPQRGIAFVPRRGINVSQLLPLDGPVLTVVRCMRMK
jgi:hypothetical protein